jgi:hypothetical protein
MAADVIAAALRRRDTSVAVLQDYERRWQSASRRETSAGAVLQSAHARPWLMRAATAACRRHDGLRSLFLALIGHTDPRPSLLSLSSLARASAAVRRPQAA